MLTKTLIFLAICYFLDVFAFFVKKISLELTEGKQSGQYVIKWAYLYCVCVFWLASSMADLRVTSGGKLELVLVGTLGGPEVTEFDLEYLGPPPAPSSRAMSIDGDDFRGSVGSGGFCWVGEEARLKDELELRRLLN